VGGKKGGGGFQEPGSKPPKNNFFIQGIRKRGGRKSSREKGQGSMPKKTRKGRKWGGGRARARAKKKKKRTLPSEKQGGKEDNRPPWKSMRVKGE